MLLIADPSLLSRYDELAFNAGTLERSIILNTQDYALNRSAHISGCNKNRIEKRLVVFHLIDTMLPFSINWTSHEKIS